VVGEPDDDAVVQGPAGRIVDGLSRVLVDQPVRRSATALSDTMRDAASVTMTPSPIDCSVVRSRSASRRYSSRVRRSASAPALISQPVPAKIRMPITCAACRPPASMRGIRKKLVVMAALSPVASSPGRRPPYHADAMTAPKNVRYGRSLPSHWARISRHRAAASVAAIATR